MKALLWSYQISPSMSKTTSEINTLFQVIFGVNVRQWFQALNHCNWETDCTYAVPEDAKEELHSDYVFLRQAVSMGGYFDTEISSYPYFTRHYGIIIKFGLHRWYMTQERRGLTILPTVLS